MMCMNRAQALTEMAVSLGLCRGLKASFPFGRYESDYNWP